MSTTQGLFRPAPPRPTDKPDLTPLLRQGDLEDILCDILAATFDSNQSVTHEAEDGRDYSLVVDKATDGTVKATLYRDNGWLKDTEVAEVRLDYTVTAVTR